jgi:hypothetical protein
MGNLQETSNGSTDMGKFSCFASEAGTKMQAQHDEKGGKTRDLSTTPCPACRILR